MREQFLEWIDGIEEARKRRDEMAETLRHMKLAGKYTVGLKKLPPGWGVVLHEEPGEEDSDGRSSDTVGPGGGGLHGLPAGQDRDEDPEAQGVEPRRGDSRPER